MGDRCALQGPSATFWKSCRSSGSLCPLGLAVGPVVHGQCWCPAGRQSTPPSSPSISLLWEVSWGRGVSPTNRTQSWCFTLLFLAYFLQPLCGCASVRLWCARAMAWRAQGQAGARLQGGEVVQEDGVSGEPRYQRIDLLQG